MPARAALKAREATREEILEMDREALARIEQAVRFALDSPDPKPEAALDDIFA